MHDKSQIWWSLTCTIFQVRKLIGHRLISFRIVYAFFGIVFWRRVWRQWTSSMSCYQSVAQFWHTSLHLVSAAYNLPAGGQCSSRGYNGYIGLGSGITRPLLLATTTKHDGLRRSIFLINYHAEFIVLYIKFKIIYVICKSYS